MRAHSQQRPPPRRRGRRTQRGIAAVEFAMTFPLLIGALGAVLSIGQMMWAKYVLIDYARAAARACTSLQPVQLSTIPTCVDTAVMLMAQTERIPCQVGSPVADYRSAGVASNPNLFNLTVSVNCTVNWDSAAGVITLVGVKNVTASSSWPFMLPQ